MWVWVAGAVNVLFNDAQRQLQSDDQRARRRLLDDEKPAKESRKQEMTAGNDAVAADLLDADNFEMQTMVANAEID